MAIKKEAPALQRGQTKKDLTMHYTTKKSICQVKNSIGEGSSLFNPGKVDHSLPGEFLGCEPSPLFSGYLGEGKGEKGGVSATLFNKARTSRQKTEENESGIGFKCGENTPQKPEKSGSGDFKGGDPPLKKEKFTKFTSEYYKTRSKQCGSRYVLIECGVCGFNHVAKVGCGFRTCPRCAREQSNRMFYGVWNVAKRLPITRVYKLRHITLGYGTEGSLRSRLLKSKKAFNKLYHNLLEKKGTGAFVTYEVGDKNGSLHLHVGYYGPYVLQKKLSDEWLRVTGGQWYADIRLMRGKKGIREVTKYITKEVARENKDVEWLYQVEVAMRGLRRFVTYGVFYDRGVFKPCFVCPICGSTEWVFIRHLDPELDKDLIKDVQDSFQFFIGDIRGSPGSINEQGLINEQDWL